MNLKADNFINGRISAMLCHNSDGTEFWLGKIGKKCVSMKSKPKTNKTKNEAIIDAKEFKKHAINMANVELSRPLEHSGSGSA